MNDMRDPQGISFEDAPSFPIHRKLAAGAFMGQITDGYILGVVGIALSYATVPLGLTSVWLGILGAASLLGILFGSFITGSLADRFGRKPFFGTVMFLAVLLSLAQFVVTDPMLLAILRFALGMCIGADYTVGIALLSEWTPAKKRSGFLAWLLVSWTVGYVLAYIVGFFMDGLGDNGWRWVLCTSAIPGAITLFFRFGVPESPSWLAGKGQVEKALENIHKHLGPNYCLPKTEEEPPSASWFRLFSPELRYNTIVSCVFFCCQVLPFFAISIFLPLVLSNMHIENPYASGVMYNGFTIVGVLVGTWLIDRISRRAFLLWTFYGAAVILTIMTVWTDMPAVLSLTMLAAFSTVLAISIVLEFAYPPELFPTELRASGIGLTIAMSRVGAASGAFLLPIVNEHYGIYAALGACIATLAIGGIVCHAWAPETSPQFSSKKVKTVAAMANL
ncbi:MFS transporter, putative metabolite transport protein [Maridesulfovibrio ferrireducens]|uniref:MFS transporter, putative metabolite transport protein n=1 Tax=Maridesulfovibrio ferrireducens TaxID=246191 RepID=A0A1G9EXT4_9BACT|nr:MFS transporter [Maridesulfovibrio ferrireducens]SDK80996.1 MFS transporter, putative metabolite transport protein [Maridesulfovibrio ferrireducens]